MAESPGVLIARPTGLTHVPNAAAVTAETVALLDELFEQLATEPSETTPTDQHKPQQ